jgi:hypothetical protein
MFFWFLDEFDALYPVSRKRYKASNLPKKQKKRAELMYQSNTCVMGSLIQKEISFRRKVRGFELKIKLILSWSDKSYEFKERK